MLDASFLFQRIWKDDGGRPRTSNRESGPRSPSPRESCEATNLQTPPEHPREPCFNRKVARHRPPRQTNLHWSKCFRIKQIAYA